MKQAASPAPTWLGIDLVKNRWIFPLLGALTTLIGGAAYAFSVFVRPLEAELAGPAPKPSRLSPPPCSCSGC